MFEQLDDMFQQLDDRDKAPQVSRAMTLGIPAAYIAGAFGGLCVFIVLGERPFGLQIATAIMYTYFAFWYVFFPTRDYSKSTVCETREFSGKCRFCSGSTAHF